MRRIIVIAMLLCAAALVAAPLALAQETPPPATGPDGLPLPEYTPTPPNQLTASPGPTRPSGSPTKCPCQTQESIPQPKPASFSYLWYILIPFWILVVIGSYLFGRASGDDGSGAKASPTAVA